MAHLQKVQRTLRKAGNIFPNETALIETLEDLVDIAIFCQFPPKFLRPEHDGTKYYEENRQVLFELLESSRDNGMGIGLWLSKEILKKNCGDINFISEFKNGAKFLISIPLATELTPVTA